MKGIRLFKIMGLILVMSLGILGIAFSWDLFLSPDRQIPVSGRISVPNFDLSSWGLTEANATQSTQDYFRKAWLSLVKEGVFPDIAKWAIEELIGKVGGWGIKCSMSPAPGKYLGWDTQFSGVNPEIAEQYRELVQMYTWRYFDLIEENLSILVDKFTKGETACKEFLDDLLKRAENWGFYINRGTKEVRFVTFSQAIAEIKGTATGAEGQAAGSAAGQAAGSATGQAAGSATGQAAGSATQLPPVNLSSGNLFDTDSVKWFNWQFAGEVSGVTYEWQVVKPDNTVVLSGKTRNGWIVISGLGEGEYKFRVRAVIGDKSSSWAERDFSIQVRQIPTERASSIQTLPPVPLWPLNDLLDTNTSKWFSWSHGIEEFEEKVRNLGFSPEEIIYQWQIKDSTGNIKQTGTTTSTRMFIRADTLGLIDGDYTFEVKAVVVRDNKVVAESEWVGKKFTITGSPVKPIAPSAPGTPAPQLSAPEEVKLTSNEIDCEGQVTLSWKEVSGATEYVVEIREQGGVNPIKTIEVSSTSLTIIPKNEGMVAGKTYEMRVKAKNASGESSFSNPVTLTVKTPPAGRVETSLPPASINNLNVSRIIEGSALSITWDPVSGANSYNIEISGEGLTTPKQFTSSEPKITISWEDLGLTPGKKYQVKVQAVDSEGKVFAESNTSFEIKELGAPVIEVTPSSIELTSTQEITISWNPVEGATEYKILVDGKEIYSTTGTKYSVTLQGLQITTPGSHEIIVKAINGKVKKPSIPFTLEVTQPSVSSAPVQTLPAPRYTSYSVALGAPYGYAIMGNSTEGSSFELQIASDKDFTQIIGALNSQNPLFWIVRKDHKAENPLRLPATSVTSVQPGIYYIRILVKNERGETIGISEPISIEIKKTPLSPPNIQTTPRIGSEKKITSDTITLNWIVGMEIESYRIEVYEDGSLLSGYPQIISCSQARSGELSFKIENLRVGKKYKIVIRALGNPDYTEPSSPVEIEFEYLPPS